MTNEKLRKIIMAALFAALACVATMIIKIPTPGTSGYIHPGDAIVILSGAILGPVWGFSQPESALPWRISLADILSTCQLPL